MSAVALTGCMDDDSAFDEGIAVEGEGGVASVDGLYGDDPVENGRITYEAYCSSCHGAEGRGDGPVAQSLAKTPGDLTQLAGGRADRFPTEDIIATIDGRRQVEAHGSREMPVWGNIWIEQGGQPVRADAVDHRINELAEYLRTLQDTTMTASS